MSPLYPLAILGRLVTPSAAYWMLMPGQCVSEAEGVVEVGVGVRMGVGVEVGVGVGVGVGVASSELPPTNVWSWLCVSDTSPETGGACVDVALLCCNDVQVSPSSQALPIVLSCVTRLGIQLHLQNLKWKMVLSQQ